MFIFSHLTIGCGYCGSQDEKTIYHVPYRKPPNIYAGSPDVWGCDCILTVWVIVHWHPIDEIHLVSKVALFSKSSIVNVKEQAICCAKIEQIWGQIWNDWSFSKSRIVSVQARSEPSAGVIWFWNGSGDTKPIASDWSATRSFVIQEVSLWEPGRLLCSIQTQKQTQKQTQIHETHPTYLWQGHLSFEK